MCVCVCVCGVVVESVANEEEAKHKYPSASALSAGADQEPCQCLDTSWDWSIEFTVPRITTRIHVPSSCLVKLHPSYPAQSQSMSASSGCMCFLGGVSSSLFQCPTQLHPLCSVHTHFEQDILRFQLTSQVSVGLWWLGT